MSSKKYDISRCWKKVKTFFAIHTLITDSFFARVNIKQLSSFSGLLLFEIPLDQNNWQYNSYTQIDRETALER